MFDESFVRSTSRRPRAPLSIRLRRSPNGLAHQSPPSTSRCRHASSRDRRRLWRPRGRRLDIPASARRALMNLRPLHDRGWRSTRSCSKTRCRQGILAIGIMRMPISSSSARMAAPPDWLIAGSVTDKILRHAASGPDRLPAATRRRHRSSSRLLCPIDFEPSPRRYGSGAVAEEGDARPRSCTCCRIRHRGWRNAATRRDRARCEEASRQRPESLVPRRREFWRS